MTNKNKILSVVAVTALILTLLPLIIVGLNARPCMDDLSFAGMSSFYPPAEADNTYYVERSVRQAVLSGNFFDTVKAVWYTVSDNYIEWQGTFSAIAVFALHPAVLFGETWYPLVMIFTLGLLLFSAALMCKTLFGKDWLLPCAGLTFLSVQWLPNLANGFFWWNGATFYTMFYSLSLLSLSAKIRLIRSNRKHFMLKAILIAFLDFFIGGGNYITALINLEICACLIAVAGAYCTNFKKRNLYVLTACFIAAAVGLMVSILAPGNAIRQSLLPKTDAIQAILLSLKQAFFDIQQWTNPVVLAFLFMCIPIFWKLTEKTRYKFGYPALILAGTFLLFASGNTPPIYALSNAGNPKIRNIIYFLYLWFMLGNTYYITGWLRRQFKIRQTPHFKLRPYYAAVLIFAAIAVKAGYSTSSFALCVDNLRSGVIKTFAQEYNRQLDMLLDDTMSNPTLEPYTVYPESLAAWDEDFLIDPIVYAIYYEKSNIDILPQKIIPVTSNRIVIIAGNRETILSCYMIKDSLYCSLRDLAYVLDDAYDVRYNDGNYSIIVGKSYTPVGGEQSYYNIQAFAEYGGNTLKSDDLDYEVTSYYIGGDVYYKFRDLMTLLDKQVVFHDEKIFIQAND